MIICRVSSVFSVINCQKVDQEKNSFVIFPKNSDCHLNLAEWKWKQSKNWTIYFFRLNLIKNNKIELYRNKEKDNKIVKTNVFI